MPVVHVTVTTELGELGNVNLENISADPNIRWIEFFRFHEINIPQPRKYCIKSSRNTVFMDDPIQSTACWFQRSKIKVKLIKNNTNPPAVGARRGPRGRNRIYTKRRSSGAGVGGNGVFTAQQQQSVAGTSTATTIRMDGPPTLPRQAPMTNGNVATGSSQAHGFEFLDDGLMNGDERAGGVEYAESICSQDSQPEDESYSEIKKDFMKRAASIRNVDFQTWQNELSKIAGSDGEYRFKRKIPMLSIFLFGWVDEAKKKRN